MPKNIQKIDRATLFLLTPIAFLTTIAMIILFNADGFLSLAEVALLLVFAAITLLLIFTLINQEKYWWAPRMLALMLLVLAISSATLIFLTDMQFGRKETIALAISLLVLGVPSALFVFWGSTSGKVFPLESNGSLPHRERLMLLSLGIAKFLVLIVVLILGTILAFEMFA